MATLLGEKIIPLWADVPPGMEARDAVPIDWGTADEALDIFRLRARLEEAAPRLELIGGLFPRGYISFIAAAPGRGKSWLVERLAIDLSLGGNILGGFAGDEPPRRVLFLAGESHWVQFKRRAEQMRWNVEQEALILYDRWDLEKHGVSLELDAEEGRVNFGKLATEYRPDVIFIDSLFDFHNSDESKLTDMRPIMNFLNNLAERHGAAVVLSHHNRKRKSSEQRLDLTADELQGSNMLNRNAAALYMLQAKAVTDSWGTLIDDAVLVRCEKSWTRKPAPFAFKIEDDDDGYHTSMRLILNPNIGASKGERVAEIVEANFEVGQWFKLCDVKRLCSTSSDATIKRALGEMLGGKKLVDNGRDKRWCEYSRT